MRFSHCGVIPGTKFQFCAYLIAPKLRSPPIYVLCTGRKPLQAISSPLRALSPPQPKNANNGPVSLTPDGLVSSSQGLRFGQARPRAGAPTNGFSSRIAVVRLLWGPLWGPLWPFCGEPVIPFWEGKCGEPNSRHATFSRLACKNSETPVHHGTSTPVHHAPSTPVHPEPVHRLHIHSSACTAAAAVILRPLS